MKRNSRWFLLIFIGLLLPFLVMLTGRAGRISVPAGLNQAQLAEGASANPELTRPAARSPDTFVGVKSSSDCVPPVDADYVGPLHAFYNNMQIDLTKPEHRSFTDCNPPPGSTPGASTTHSFSSIVRANVHMNGMPTMFVEAPGMVTVKVTFNNQTGNTRVFDTEMLQLDINGGSLPTGVMIRESPTRQSIGQTTIATVTGGFNINSYFDIFTELSLDGGQTWSPSTDQNGQPFAGHVVAVTPNPVVGDFDGDGKTDIAVFRPSNSYWFITLSSNQAFRAYPWGTPGDMIVPADYDGDQKTDLGVFRPSNGTWYIFRSSTSALQAMQWGLNGDTVVPADYDGDGKADIAVFRSSTGTWYIWQSSDGSMRAQPFGANGDIPVTGDYDGDGKADLAVYRPSNGIWYLLRSSDGTFSAQQFGLTTDKPVQSDYDADGKTDIAVYRPSNGTWYLLQSTAGFYAQQFGLATDRPAPGDYDGDGKTDIAVWRATSGNWYVSNSGGNPAVTVKTFGLSGDTPVPSAYIP